MRLHVIKITTPETLVSLTLLLLRGAHTQQKMYIGNSTKPNPEEIKLGRVSPFCVDLMLNKNVLS